MGKCPHESMFEHRLAKAFRIASTLRNLRSIKKVTDLIPEQEQMILKLTGYDHASEATWKIVQQLLDWYWETI